MEAIIFETDEAIATSPECNESTVVLSAIKQNHCNLNVFIVFHFFTQYKTDKAISFLSYSEVLTLLACVCVCVCIIVIGSPFYFFLVLFFRKESLNPDFYKACPLFDFLRCLFVILFSFMFHQTILFYAVFINIRREGYLSVQDKV